MTPVLVDSNVIIDLADRKSRWYRWSAEAIRRVVAESHLVVNPVIYAEVSAGYDQIVDVERVFPRYLFHREDVPYPAAFYAGHCYEAYRRRGGLKRSPLPDFFIGAHAAVAGYRLLTRDARRYRTYFPGIGLIAPN